MQFILALLIIIVDQITKYVIVSNLSVFQSIPIIENIFHITYIRNKGMAFGMMQNQRLFFLIVTTIVVGGILIYYFKNKSSITGVFKYSLFMVIAGAIGNLIDRVRLSYVVDFFDFRIWPVFNIADIAIVSGTILLCYYIFFIEPKLSKEKED